MKHYWAQNLSVIRTVSFGYSIVVTSSVALSLTGFVGLLLFDIKWYEQTLCPGLRLSDSCMTVVHNFTVGISLLDPYCLLCEQYCFYQFSCIVADLVCGFMSPFIITSSVLLLLVQVLALMLCMSFLHLIFGNTILFGHVAHI